MAVCGGRELNAFLHLAVGLQKCEDSQMVQIVIVLFNECEELLLQDLHLFLFDFSLCSEKLLVLSLPTISDPMRLYSGNLRKHKLCNPGANNEPLCRQLVLWLRRVFPLLPLWLLLCRRSFSFRHSF